MCMRDNKVCYALMNVYNYMLKKENRLLYKVIVQFSCIMNVVKNPLLIKKLHVLFLLLFCVFLLFCIELKFALFLGYCLLILVIMSSVDRTVRF